LRRRGAIERDWAGGGYFSVSGEPGVAGPARRRRWWGSACVSWWSASPIAGPRRKRRTGFPA